MSAPIRSGVSSRSRGPTTFEAGLHADADFGAIDVGLAVDGPTVGVVIDAPVVGQLRVAFDVAADGATRVSNLARKTSEGVEAAVSLVDETKTQALEAEVDRLRQYAEALSRDAEEAKSQLVTERDEARDRAAFLGEDLKSVRDELNRAATDAAANLAEAHAAIQVEKDARLMLLGEREKARAELDRVRGEIDAGSATLMREVNEARAAKDAAEADRARLSQELGELSKALEARREELADLRATHTATAQALTDLKATHELVERELKAAEVDREQLRGSLADATATRERLELDLEQRTADLATRNAEFDQLQAELRELQATRDELQNTLNGDRTSAEQTLIELRESLAAKDKALAATAADRHQLVQTHRDALAEAASRESALKAALAAAEADQGQLGSELDQVKSSAAAREAELTAELEAVRHDLLASEGTRRSVEENLEQREAAFADAVEQRDTALAERDAAREQLEQLQASDTELAAARQRAADAEAALAEHEARAGQLLAERDEARTVARGLHQKLAAAGADSVKAELASLKSQLEREKDTAAKVTVERDRVQLQVEALSRQLDQERSNRAKAVLERDQYRDRFRALTTSSGSGEMVNPTSSLEETKTYSIGQATTQEVPAYSGVREVPTDITQLPADVTIKKKGP